MKKLLFFALFWGMSAMIHAQEITIPQRENAKSQQDKPYVILISIDGFRYDYVDKFDLEFLKSQRRKGTWATAMIPSYPSVTFPNHYTLVTGLIPPHHGLIGNTMYDPKLHKSYSLGNAKAVKNAAWYGGIPIWSWAEQHQLLTACFYWPGSEAPIGGYLPTYFYPYSEKIGIDKRIKQVVSWLELPEAKRPHLITFYMPQVDHAGHSFGPDALETRYAAKFVDAALQRLTEAVAETEFPVNFVVVSDHGMTKLDTEHPITLPQHNPYQVKEVNNGVYVSVFVRDKAVIDAVKAYYQTEAKNYEVYLASEVPERYHFSKKEDRFNRMGDIVLIAHAPYYFSRGGAIPRGSHGFLPAETPDMQAFFMSWGPQIKKHNQIDVFKNIHVFPLLTELLELDNPKNLDGDQRLLPLVLKAK